MQFRSILGDWHGQGGLSDQYPTMNHGKLVLVLGDPSDPYRGPVDTGEVSHLCIVKGTGQERAALAQAGYKVADE